MARMPGAIWRPLAANWASMPRIEAHDIFCLHTMVGSLAGTDNYFRTGNGAGYAGTESHFGVGADGTIYQWQDTDYQADANYNGRWHVISSENADTGTGFPAWTGSNVPAFTAAQVEANAKIAAWLHKTHGIPLDIIPDSKVGRRGIGWHRQGVPGYVVSGGELWSTAPGKVCPGDRRIAQIPAIRDRARQLVAGPIQEDDMTPQEMLQARMTAADGKQYTVESVWALTNNWAYKAFAEASAARVAAEQAKAIAEAAAKSDGPLSDADVARIAEATAAEVAEDLSEGYDLTATPKGDQA